MKSDAASGVAVILAAGKGTRMKSTRAKALFPLCGQPLAVYPVRAMRQAGIARVVLVIGYQAEEVRQAVGDRVDYVLQEEQLGTGHALLCCEEALRGFTGAVFVHCVDTPLLPAAVIARVMSEHRAQGNAATLLTAKTDDPGNYGRIVRTPSGQVARIVEARDASPDELALHEVNTGTYCF